MVSKYTRLPLVAPALLGLAGSDSSDEQTAWVLDGVRGDTAYLLSSSDVVDPAGGSVFISLDEFCHESGLASAEVMGMWDEGVIIATSLITDHRSGPNASWEGMIEWIVRSGNAEVEQIMQGLASPEWTASWWKAWIKLLAIINFFSVLPWAYSKTIGGALKGKWASPITFAAFTFSNGLGAAGAVASETPLMGLGYALAFGAAILTTWALAKRQKINANLWEENARLRAENDQAKARIAQLEGIIKNRTFVFTDSITGKNYEVPYSLVEKNATFSVYDIDGKPVYFTDGLLQTLGYTKEEIDAHYAEHGEIISLLYPEEHEREHVRSFLTELSKSGKGYKATFYPTAKNGRKLAIEFSTEPIFDTTGKIIGTVRFGRDVTGEHAAKQMLHVDMLTGEANRHGFEKRFHESVVVGDTHEHHGPERRHTPEAEFPKNIVMAFGDVDAFKAVNDTYGHGNADVLLKEIAIDLRKVLRDTDTVARLGGDEFAVMCEGGTIEAIAPKLFAILQEFSRTVFHIKDGVRVGEIVCDSQEAARQYAQTKNHEALSEGEIYAGGVSLSLGLTEQRLDRPLANEAEAIQFRSRCEQRAEKYAAHFLKHFGKIRPGRESKNGVAYPQFAENGGIRSVTIMYRPSTDYPDGEKIVIDDPEELARALAIIEEEGAKGREVEGK